MNHNIQPPSPSGSNPGETSDTKTRGAYGIPTSPSSSCPSPRGSVTAGGLGLPRELITPFSLDICSCPHPVLSSISSPEAPATHPAGPMNGILSDFFHHCLGKGGDKCRADTGHGLLNTWVPLDNTGSWGGGCVPSLSLPVTHWTPLAENLGGRKDKKGRKLFPCAYPWNCSQLWLPPPPSPIHWTWGFPITHLPSVL